MNWEIGIDMYTLLILCIKQVTNKNLLYRQGTPLGALWCPKCEGNPREAIYVCVWLIHFAVQ